MQIKLMKPIPKLISVCVTTFILYSNAQAALSMPEREHVQTIIWIVDAVTFVTAIGIGLLVWKVSKKDLKAKNKVLKNNQIK